MAGLPDRIPIFPLPGTVLFPGVHLPLHVFEPRYRQMVGDALRGDRVLGVVLLRPGWEADYEGSPETHAVGCAGPMEEVESLPDGRYLLRLAGTWKFRIGRYLRHEPYRVAAVEPLAEVSSPAEDDMAPAARTRLLAAANGLLSLLAGRPEAPFAVGGDLDHALLVNLACMHLVEGSAERQRLLELPGPTQRGREVTELLEGRLVELLARRPPDGPASVH